MQNYFSCKVTENGLCLRWSAVSGGGKKVEAALRIRMFFVTLWDCLFCGCFLCGKLASHCCVKVWSRLDKSERTMTGKRGSGLHKEKRLNDGPCTGLKSSISAGLAGREHLHCLELFCFL